MTEASSPGAVSGFPNPEFEPKLRGWKNSEMSILEFSVSDHVFRIALINQSELHHSSPPDHHVALCQLQTRRNCLLLRCAYGNTSFFRFRVLFPLLFLVSVVCSVWMSWRFNPLHSGKGKSMLTFPCALGA